MHVLALDTTTRDGSVALVTEHGVVDERRGDASRTHVQRMPGEILDLIGTHGMSVGAIDLFAALVDSVHRGFRFVLAAD